LVRDTDGYGEYVVVEHDSGRCFSVRLSESKAVADLLQRVFDADSAANQDGEEVEPESTTSG
jgi:hypothetical protein